MSVLAFVPAHALLGTNEPLQVEQGIVHTWGFELTAEREDLEYCTAQLSRLERERAYRFIQDRHRDQYIVAHGVLRHMLARYSGQSPEALQFEFGPAGKPRLADSTIVGLPQAISFNLAHSDHRALLAVSDGRELGVDLERRRNEIEATQLARNYFFGSEREDVERGSPDQQRDTFFRYWVAKEAALKAEGVGLGLPLDLFEIRFQKDGFSAEVASFDEERMSPDWYVRLITCDTGWYAAAAARGHEWRFL